MLSAAVNNPTELYQCLERIRQDPAVTSLSFPKLGRRFRHMIMPGRETNYEFDAGGDPCPETEAIFGRSQPIRQEPSHAPAAAPAAANPAGRGRPTHHRPKPKPR